MSRRVEAVVYSDIEDVTPANTEEFLNRYLNGEIPAFVVRDAGVSIDNAMKLTAIESMLAKRNYEFEYGGWSGYDIQSSLPANEPESFNPVGYRWSHHGVTAAHFDELGDNPNGKRRVTLNHTSEGASEYFLHKNRENDNGPEQTSGITRDLLWRSEVDPELIDPNGYRTRIIPRDLIVFDSNYVHLVRTIKSPRSSHVVHFVDAG